VDWVGARSGIDDDLMIITNLRDEGNHPFFKVDLGALSVLESLSAAYGSVLLVLLWIGL